MAAVETLELASKFVNKSNCAVAIVQSNYIPWKGYFDLIGSCEHFVIYDESQYTKRDWRNRNLIKTPKGLRWLSVPVSVKSKFHQRIAEAVVADKKWAREHWLTLVHSYRRAPGFRVFKDKFHDLYSKAEGLEYLSDINTLFIREICSILDISTKIYQSSEFELESGKNERLVGICKAVGADKYVSGPAAKCYLDTDNFASEGVVVEWFKYGPYKEYEQLYSPFEHRVSVLDFLFSLGEESTEFFWSQRLN